MLVGGRVVPSFTHNWLARDKPGRLPAPFGRFDVATIGASAGALALWIAIPSGAGNGHRLGMVAGVLQAARLARWAGDRAFAEPLVLMLHIGYAFIAAGFLLTAAAPSAGWRRAPASTPGRSAPSAR